MNHILLLLVGLCGCFANAQPALPFPPLKGTLVKGFHTNLPPAMLEILDEDGRKLEKFNRDSHKHGKRTTYKFDLRKSGAKPRFSVEQFALEVAAKLDFPDGLPDHVVAFEYWVQRRTHTEHIKFHYDKDESHASIHQQMVFPVKGTVTYLSDIGAPTVVLNQTTNQYGNNEVPVIPTNGFVSFPVKGKHIWFHGKAQHGVHPQLNPKGTAGERYTLLVNWWSKLPDEPNCVFIPNEELERMRVRTIPPQVLKKWSAEMATPIESKAVHVDEHVDVTPVTFVIPANDHLTYKFPEMDTSISSLWSFSLAPPYVGMLGELDPQINTQRAHIVHSKHLFGLAFVSAANRAMVADILHPIQWEVTHGGMVIDRLELLLADSKVCASVITAYEIDVNKLPQLLLIDVPNSNQWVMDKPFTDANVRAFLQSHIGPWEKHTKAHSEL